MAEQPENRAGTFVTAGGAGLLIRPIRPEDRDALAAAFRALSDQSRYRRFFVLTPELSPQQLDYLVQIDHHDHEALVAIEQATGDLIAVARYVRLDHESAEPAIVVSDRWQRQGLAGRLLTMLVQRAREEGITRFVAPILTDNTAALAAFRRLGDSSLTVLGPESELTIDIRESVDADSRMRDLLLAMLSGALAPARGALELWGRGRQPPLGLAHPIVVGLDQSAAGSHAAEAAAAIAVARGLPVFLIGVYRPLLDDRIVVQELLARAGSRLREEGVVVTEQLIGGDPALSLLYEALRVGAGMIVVEAPPRTPGGVRPPGVWDEVAHNASCNVLVLQGSKR